MGKNEIGIGVIGCGGFGLYALEHFLQVPGVKLIGVTDVYRPAAEAAAQRFGVPDMGEIDKLVDHDDVDLVYIATPPFLHCEQSLLAMRAGKHVICEKPFAMTMAEADEMIATAHQNDLLVIANLMQRYNSIYGMVKQLIDSGILGDVLHGYFENYASDEQLGAEHWFWDRAKSGGIFIEHGVHFFDMFAGWLGEGRVEAAQLSVRAGTDIEDQFHCTIRYGDTVLVNHYHGFTQVARMDRQEIRLLFERGDVTLYEWVPTRVRIHAVANEEATRRLYELFPDARLETSQSYAGVERACRGRHKDLEVDQQLILWYGEGYPKMERYGELLRGMLEDQIAWIRDRSHVRTITEENGRASLAMAVEADRLARD